MRRKLKTIARKVHNFIERVRMSESDYLTMKEQSNKFKNMMSSCEFKLDEPEYTDVKDADGNITCATMYIDVPNMTVARMSTAALDKRYTFTGDEDIADLLKISTQGW